MYFVLFSILLTFLGPKLSYYNGAVLTSIFNNNNKLQASYNKNRFRELLKAQKASTRALHKSPKLSIEVCQQLKVGPFIAGRFLRYF